MKYYTPKARPTKGAEIRIGNSDTESIIVRPIGSGLLQKFSVDAMGAIAGRRVSYGTPGLISRQNTYGRDRLSLFAGTTGPRGNG